MTVLAEKVWTFRGLPMIDALSSAQLKTVGRHRPVVMALLKPTACPDGLPAPFEKKPVREGRSIGTDAEALCPDGSIAGNDTTRGRARR